MEIGTASSAAGGAEFKANLPEIIFGKRWRRRSIYF